MQQLFYFQLFIGLDIVLWILSVMLAQGNKTLYAVSTMLSVVATFLTIGLLIVWLIF
jgi:hypothetical protein